MASVTSRSATCCGMATACVQELSFAGLKSGAAVGAGWQRHKCVEAIERTQRARRRNPPQEIGKAKDREARKSVDRGARQGLHCLLCWQRFQGLEKFHLRGAMRKCHPDGEGECFLQPDPREDSALPCRRGEVGSAYSGSESHRLIRVDVPGGAGAGLQAAPDREQLRANASSLCLCWGCKRKGVCVRSQPVPNNLPSSISFPRAALSES